MILSDIWFYLEVAETDKEELVILIKGWLH
jgi:hypothetical protein